MCLTSQAMYKYQCDGLESPISRRHGVCSNGDASQISSEPENAKLNINSLKEHEKRE